MPALENVHAAAAGVSPTWDEWGIALALSVLACLLGFTFYQHSREEFADVM